MTRPILTISDHALVRHMERVMGYDIPALRRQLEGRLSEAAAIGATGITINRFTYLIENGVVITVLRRNNRGLHLKPSERERA
jgi:hypothetical protein